MFLSHVIGGKHLSSRADFVAMVQGATPDVVLTGVELLAEVAGDTVVSSMSGARRPMCTASSSSTRRTPGWAARSSPRPGSPAPSRATGHAVVGGEHGRGGRARRTCCRPPSAAVDDVGFVPVDAAEQDSTRSSPARPSGLALRRHAGRQQGRGQPRGPGRRAQRQGPPRGRTARRIGRRAAPRPGRSRRTRVRGQRRRGRGRLAAPGAPAGDRRPRTTCSPRPACSPPSTRRPPVGSSVISPTRRPRVAPVSNEADDAPQTSAERERLTERLVHQLGPSSGRAAPEPIPSRSRQVRRTSPARRSRGGSTSRLPGPGV